MLQEKNEQLKKFYVISAILGILPAILLLPFSFWLNDIWLEDINSCDTRHTAH